MLNYKVRQYIVKRIDKIIKGRQSTKIILDKKVINKIGKLEANSINVALLISATNGRFKTNINSTQIISIAVINKINAHRINTIFDIEICQN